MDEQMIEQMARAIFEAHNATYTVGGPAKWESDPEHWRRYARAAHSVIAGRVAEQRQRIEAAFVKGADVAVFIANQRQNPQPPTGSQLDEIADFLAAVRDAL